MKTFYAMVMSNGFQFSYVCGSKSQIDAFCRSYNDTHNPGHAFRLHGNEKACRRCVIGEYPTKHASEWKEAA
jgi:hypothetical protein